MLFSNGTTVKYNVPSTTTIEQLKNRVDGPAMAKNLFLVNTQNGKLLSNETRLCDVNLHTSKK